MRARVAGDVHIGIRDLGEVRFGELERMVHEVAGDQRVFTVGLDPERRLPGSVTGRWFEPETVTQIGIGLDDVGEARGEIGAIESPYTSSPGNKKVRTKSSSVSV